MRSKFYFGKRVRYAAQGHVVEHSFWSVQFRAWGGLMKVYSVELVRHDSPVSSYSVAKLGLSVYRRLPSVFLGGKLFTKVGCGVR